MARFVVILALLTLTIAVAAAADSPAASPKPSVLTPYAAAPPDSSDAEDPSVDGFADNDAAPVGAPSSDNYPPVENESNAATIVGVSSAAATLIVGLGHLIF